VFEGSRSRSVWPLALLAFAVAVAGAAAVWSRPAVIERLGVLAGGGDPFASPLAEGRSDHRYPESPLAVSLELEAGFTEVDREGVVTFADALARDLGFWLLARTGTGSVEAAEQALWAEPGGPDAFAVAWALRMQDLNLYARDTQRLSAGVKPEGFRYAHSDELALLLAHVAWRLDLGMDLVRSPVHRYVLWRQPGSPALDGPLGPGSPALDGPLGPGSPALDGPLGPGGDRLRGIEPTCFRRVDVLGDLVPSEEPSVGRRLVFPPEHYPSGAGGIRNPAPLPAGAYEVVAPEALASDLLVRLVERYGGGLAALEARLGESGARRTGQRTPLDATAVQNRGLLSGPAVRALPVRVEARAGDDPAPVAQAVYRIRLSSGVAAWERGDLAAVRREAAALGALRTARGGLLPEAPDEAALQAVVAFADGDAGAGRAAVRRVLAHHDRGADGPLLFARSDAHAAAMWLELEHGAPALEDWNSLVVPLLNRYRERPERIEALCRIGRRVLKDAVQTVEELVPECRG
jgi:hypothetical protein